MKWNRRHRITLAGLCARILSSSSKAIALPLNKDVTPPSFVRTKRRETDKSRHCSGMIDPVRYHRQLLDNRHHPPSFLPPPSFLLSPSCLLLTFQISFLFLYFSPFPLKTHRSTSWPPSLPSLLYWSVHFNHSTIQPLVKTTHTCQSSALALLTRMQEHSFL